MKAETYLLDTDIFSYLVSGRYPAVRAHVAAAQKSVLISSITLAEALFGARKKQSAKLESLISLFRELFPVLAWDAAAADAYASLRVAVEAAGTPIGSMDLMIAAVAVAGGHTLVTNKTRHFKHVPGLKFVNWTKA